MALSTTELVELYSSMETKVIRTNNLTLNLVQRTYEPSLQNAYTVKVPSRNNTVTATGYSRGSDWKTLQGADVSLQDMTMDQSSEVGNQIRFEDMRESPLNLMMTVADDQGYAHAKRIDQIILHNMQDNVSSSSPDHVNTLGSATNYISGGAGATTTADAYVYQALAKIRNEMMTMGVMHTGDNMQQPWAVMTTNLYSSFEDYIIEQKYADAIALETLRANTVLRPTPGAMGRFFGIDIYVTDHLAEDTVSSKGYDVLLAGINAATEVALRPPIVQMLTPQTNQDSPQYVLRSIRQLARLVVRDDLLWKAQIRNEA